MNTDCQTGHQSFLFLSLSLSFYLFLNSHSSEEHNEVSQKYSFTVFFVCIFTPFQNLQTLFSSYSGSFSCYAKIYLPLEKESEDKEIKEKWAFLLVCQSVSTGQR